ncbi:MAG: NTP transferase domain-containing protein [Candidatus Hydrogenedentes bacterium]|jgi:UDP-N-acetylglucosamine diphosphorylase/glucosamine-1-phosphate N-acetyltransferase|nr:NTP transferase domain-containing protein [Candidatus Hydrogenedentota bacterium]
MQAVIMAAGKSTRTWPLTLTRPKPLLPVMNTPLMAHQLTSLEGIVDEVILITGYLGDMIHNRFGESFHNIRLRYVEQTEQHGTGHAVQQAEPAVNGPFIVLNGDDLYDPEDLKRLASRPGQVLVREVDQPERFGIFEIDEQNRALSLEEKPEKPRTRLANLGAYSFGTDVFRHIEKIEPSPRGEIEVTDALKMMIEDNALHVVLSQGYYLTIGYAWHLLEANHYWLDHFLSPQQQGTLSPRAEIIGNVHIGRGTQVRSGVVIEGPVYIGEECTIGPNAWIRPHTTIGDGCHIGQACEIKASILFDHVFASHQNYVGDSIIGAHTNLGCGTNIANVRHDGAPIRCLVRDELIDTGRVKLGAIIGDHVHTGVNTAIYPGRNLSPHSTTLPGCTVRFDTNE